VRVIAPSGVFDRGVFEAGLERVGRAGWEVRVDERIFEAHRYCAGPAERRLEELNAALHEADTKAIWVARGGYGVGPLLSGVTWPGAERAKWLVGFSDVTALHLYWQAQGVASLHGANMTTVGEWSDEAVSELCGLLAAPAGQVFSGTRWGEAAQARGRITGGNLTVMTSLAGTGHLPDLGGRIVLLEDIGERPYRLDRSLFQLKAAGAFEGVAGFVIGQLTNCDSGSDEYSALDVVCESLASLGAPILRGLPVGHERTSRALLLGVEAILDTGEETLSLHGGATC
jgi:muramoyltetrapeptide carboxypeptidase